MKELVKKMNKNYVIEKEKVEIKVNEAKLENNILKVKTTIKNKNKNSVCGISLVASFYNEKDKLVGEAIKTTNDDLMIQPKSSSDEIFEFKINDEKFDYIVFGIYTFNVFLNIEGLENSKIKVIDTTKQYYL